MLIKFLIIIISLILIGILANYSGKLVELIKLANLIININKFFISSIITPANGPKAKAPIRAGTSLKSILSHGNIGITGKSIYISITAIADKSDNLMNLFVFKVFVFIFSPPKSYFLWGY